MSVSEALDSLRSEIAGCSLVAFADLSSKIVLTASSAMKPAREELDALSAAAYLVLDGAVADGAAAVWGEQSDISAETAMLLSQSEARIFLRSPGENPEALICVCAPDCDLNAVVDCARTTLKRIVSET
ncbi:MAG: hypothetical protein HKN27_08145 [Silicimonas sp.]|nr:hypothetical protein [Silicimonas sp.]